MSPTKTFAEFEIFAFIDFSVFHIFLEVYFFHFISTASGRYVHDYTRVTEAMMIFSAFFTTPVFPIAEKVIVVELWGLVGASPDR